MRPFFPIYKLSKYYTDFEKYANPKNPENIESGSGNFFFGIITIFIKFPFDALHLVA